MIKINLLPEEMEGGGGGFDAASSENAGSLLVALALLVIFGANAALGGYLLVNKNRAESDLAEVRDQAAEIEAALEETEETYESEQADLRRMERLVEVAQSLAPTDRLLWSKKLNMLPLLVPEGVYLEVIEVSQSVNERETEESKNRRNEWQKEKRGTAPPIERVPVYSQILRLQGIAYVPDGTDTQRLQQFIQFIRSLQENTVSLPFESEQASFMDQFQSTLSVFPVTQKSVAGRDVTEFRVDIQAEPMVIQ